jgi:hypothetical protein
VVCTLPAGLGQFLWDKFGGFIVVILTQNISAHVLVLTTIAWRDEGGIVAAWKWVLLGVPIENSGHGHCAVARVAPCCYSGTYYLDRQPCRLNGNVRSYCSLVRATYMLEGLVILPFQCSSKSHGPLVGGQDALTDDIYYEVKVERLMAQGDHLESVGQNRFGVGRLLWDSAILHPTCNPLRQRCAAIELVLGNVEVWFTVIQI